MTAQELIDAKKTYDELDAYFRNKHTAEIKALFSAEMRQPRCRAAYANGKEERAYNRGCETGESETRGAFNKALTVFQKDGKI